jgi:hypothetical protein
METAMTNLKMLLAGALISAIPATSALAQAAISELGAYQAQYPDRDALNGGALTPAGRMGLERPDGVAPQNAYAAMDTASPVRPHRHRSASARRHP